MRLIDADALVENIKSEIDDDKEIYPDDKTSIMFRAGMKTVIRIVKNQDTVDPVKHGHWIEGCPTETTDYFNCSVCNAGIFVNNLWRVSYEDVSEIHRFCHNCGAKMDQNTGGDNNGSGEAKKE